MNLHDVDIYGREDSKGQPLVYYDEEAIKNALYLWLTSKKGDFIKNPSLGGIFDKSLFKNLNKKNLSLLKTRITVALEEFTPAITILGLSVEPDYENRLWEINIQYKTALTNKAQALSIYTKDMSKRISLEYVEVDYLGDNLKNFCIIKKPEMKGSILEFDVERDRWKWGSYLLNPEFGTSSDNFEEILTICNAS